jgi:hypothetical protein
MFQSESSRGYPANPAIELAEVKQKRYPLLPGQRDRTMKNNLKLAYGSACCLIVSSPVLAQSDRNITMLKSVQLWLTTISVTAVTLALMFVGIRMVFNQAQWNDVAPVFWVGAMIGAVLGLASLLIS